MLTKSIVFYVNKAIMLTIGVNMEYTHIRVKKETKLRLESLKTGKESLEAVIVQLLDKCGLPTLPPEADIEPPNKAITPKGNTPPTNDNSKLCEMCQGKLEHKSNDLWYCDVCHKSYMFKDGV